MDNFKCKESCQNLLLNVKIWTLQAAGFFLYPHIFEQIYYFIKNLQNLRLLLTNWWIINFSGRWYLLNVLHRFSFLHFSENQQNSQLILKIWILSWLIFFLMRFFVLHKCAIISPKIGKIHNYQNINIRRRKRKRNISSFYWDSSDRMNDHLIMEKS